MGAAGATGRGGAGAAAGGAGAAAGRGAMGRWREVGEKEREGVWGAAPLTLRGALPLCRPPPFAVRLLALCRPLADDKEGAR